MRETEEEGTLPNSFCEARVTPIPKPDKDTPRKGNGEMINGTKGKMRRGSEEEGEEEGEKRRWREKVSNELELLRLSGTTILARRPVRIMTCVNRKC